MTRRSFFARLVGAAAAVVVAPRVAPAPADTLRDPATGIAIRFIRQYDIERDRFPTRLFGGHLSREAVQAQLEADDLRFKAGDRW